MRKFTFSLFFLIAFQTSAVCQATGLDIKYWATKLADPSDKNNEAAFSLHKTLYKYDSVTVFNFLDKLEAAAPDNKHYFIARFNCVKSQSLVLYNPPFPEFYPFSSEVIKKKVTALLETAMEQAFVTDDDYLVAYVSGLYGNIMSGFQQPEKAMMYMMNSVELYDKVHLYGTPGTYSTLGELLWHMREYEKSIHYSKIAISQFRKSDDKLRSRYEITCSNTIGLSFQRMKQYDSAFFYYHKALEMCSQESDTSWGLVWEGIISGNMAQIYYDQGKYTTALPLFIQGYQSSKKYEIFDDAANSLQWAAKTNLALGNKSEALNQVRESFRLLLKWPTAANYRQNAFQTASQIYEAIGNKDSAYYYSTAYSALHDSLEKKIFQSSIGVSQLRFNNEKSRYDIQKLEREKGDEVERRNYIILFIVFLCVAILLFINRKHQRLKYTSRLEHAERMRLDEERKSSLAQLNLITKTIIEKTAVIDKLQEQVKNNNIAVEEEELIKVISNQTILTEEEWINFRNLFEKIHPDFFEKIITKISGITQAEQRMAALTLLQLTTRQMAAVLGISLNSVNKSKQRLRQRFNLQSDQEVEFFLAKL